MKSNKVGDQTIEAMLAVDQKMAQYYGMDAVKYYALTIANVVSIFSQPAFSCSKLKIKTLEQGVKYAQS